MVTRLGGGHSNSPRFPLAVDKQVVKEEEGSLLDVARRDLQQVALKEELCADVCEVGALGREWRAAMSSQGHTRLMSLPLLQRENSLAKATQGRRVDFSPTVQDYSPPQLGGHEQKLEAAGCITSTVRKQRAMNVRCSAHSASAQSRIPAREWSCHNSNESKTALRGIPRH